MRTALLTALAIVLVLIWAVAYGLASILSPWGIA
jgi:hypothetical protein